MAKEVKRMVVSEGKFEANGKTYIIENAFSIERYAEYQLIEKEVGFGITFKEIFDNLMKLKGMMNSSRFVDASFLLVDMMRGVQKLEYKEPLVLRMCALFINTPDEDRTTINEDMITRKIEDWKKEGLDIRDFFTLALNTMDGFIEIYQKLTQTTSEKAGKAK
jgi:hypothetical protein